MRRGAFALLCSVAMSGCLADYSDNAVYKCDPSDPARPQDCWPRVRGASFSTFHAVDSGTAAYVVRQEGFTAMNRLCAGNLCVSGGSVKP